MANYTDISSRPGKGPRLHRNVSNPSYRAGWDKIFGKKRSKPSSTIVKLDKPFVKCMECDGYGELPVGAKKVVCPVCNGEGKLTYAD